jgi:hypothetical protein
MVVRGKANKGAFPSHKQSHYAELENASIISSLSISPQPLSCTTKICGASVLMVLKKCGNSNNNGSGSITDHASLSSIDERSSSFNQTKEGQYNYPSSPSLASVSVDDEHNFLMPKKKGKKNNNILKNKKKESQTTKLLDTTHIVRSVAADGDRPPGAFLECILFQHFASVPDASANSVDAVCHGGRTHGHGHRQGRDAFPPYKGEVVRRQPRQQLKYRQEEKMCNNDNNDSDGVTCLISLAALSSPSATITSAVKKKNVSSTSTKSSIKSPSHVDRTKIDSDIKADVQKQRKNMERSKSLPTPRSARRHVSPKVAAVVGEEKPVGRLPPPNPVPPPLVPPRTSPPLPSMVIKGRTGLPPRVPSPSSSLSAVGTAGLSSPISSLKPPVRTSTPSPTSSPSLLSGEEEESQGPGQGTVSTAALSPLNSSNYSNSHGNCFSADDDNDHEADDQNRVVTYDDGIWDGHFSTLLDVHSHDVASDDIIEDGDAVGGVDCGHDNVGELERNHPHHHHNLQQQHHNRDEIERLGFDQRVLQSLHNIERTRQNSDSDEEERDTFMDEIQTHGDSSDPFDNLSSHHSRWKAMESYDYGESNRDIEGKDRRQGSDDEGTRSANEREIIASLKQETDQYHSEAMALREEIEMIKSQLAEFRKYLPNVSSQEPSSSLSSNEDEGVVEPHQELQQSSVESCPTDDSSRKEGSLRQRRISRNRFNAQAENIRRTDKRIATAKQAKKGKKFDFASYARSYYSREEIRAILEANNSGGDDGGGDAESSLPYVAQSPRSMDAIQKTARYASMVTPLQVSTELGRKYRREWARNDAIARADSRSKSEGLVNKESNAVGVI